MPEHVLITGGAGFIGSHTVVEIVNAGYAVTIVDSLVNSSEESVERVKRLVSAPELIDVEQADLLDKAALEKVFAKHTYSTVIHFAALKAVGESVAKPLEYYENNIGGLLNVLRGMVAHGIPTIIFSSSATVYGDATPPFTESSFVGAGITNPYGQTKFMAEQILKDFQKANPAKTTIALRYFNPVGAHPSGTIGEDPQGIPNNLMPRIQWVATGREKSLTVLGTDYDTPDGTALRDYIHVVDLAQGHLKAMEWVHKSAASRTGGVHEVFNLGTGQPISVLQAVAAFEAASGTKIPLTMGARRPGDAPSSYAVPDKARDVLGWTASRGIDEMCADVWRWVSANPRGFKK